MKNLLKSLLLAASAFVLLAGCNQLGLSDATVDGATYSDGVCYLTISVDNLTSVASAERSAARTINPVAFEGTGDDNVAERNLLDKFILKGVSATTGDDFEEEIFDWVDPADHSKGKKTEGKIAIPYGAWELTLEAYQGEKLVLQGKIFENLKRASSGITFKLTTDGIDEEGGVNLAGTYDDEDGVAKSYHAGLYEILTGKLVAGTEVSADITEGTKKFTYNPKEGENEAATEYFIAPGRYSFQVKFFNAEKAAVTADSAVVGYWEDTIVVAPGRITKDVSIECKKIINQLPDSPENLRAYFKDGSDSPDGYTVILTWDDKSNNEENFVITIDEYESQTDTETGNTVIAKKNDSTVKLGADDANDTTIVSFFDSPYYVAGSVHASSTSASIKLPYGRLFEVSIQAENFVGLSDADDAEDGIQACERIGEATASLPACVTAADKLFTVTDAKNRINRYAINYDLDGGTLKLHSGETKNGVYSVYGSIYDFEEDDDKKLSTLLLNTTKEYTESDNTKKKNVITSLDGYAFANWVTAVGTVITATSTEELTFAGINVKADYDNKTTISYTIDNKYYTISTVVKYDGNDVVNDTVTATTEATRNKDLTFTVTASDDTLTVEKVAVKISNENTFIRGEGTGAGCTVSTKNLDAGNHTVVVTAVVGGKTYQNSFPLVYIR